MRPFCILCGRYAENVPNMVTGMGGSICVNCVMSCMDMIPEETRPFTMPQLRISSPFAIKNTLDKYVIGQHEAKVILSTAVYNHYKRINNKSNVEIQKSNILMLGPTGSGKTLLAQTLSRMLKLPFAMGDATNLTESGYVGEDVEDLLIRLYRDAEENIEFAERGIIYIDECFPGDTEILTDRGFIRFDLLNKTEKIAQANKNGTVTYVSPERYIKKKYTGNLIKWSNSVWSHTSTPEHNRIVLDRNNIVTKIKAKDKVVSNWKVPAGGILQEPLINTKNSYTDYELMLIVAFYADGCVKNKKYGYMSLKKDRKIKRLFDIIEKVGIRYTSAHDGREDYTEFYFGNLENEFPILLEKKFTREFLSSLTSRQRCLLIEELSLWDGHKVSDTCFQFFSSDKEEINLLQEYCHLTGYRANILARKKRGYRDNYALTIQRRNVYSQQRLNKGSIPFKGNVYCVTVPSGMIIIRQDGHIQVTGNCDKLSKKTVRGQINRDISGEGVQQGLLRMMEGSRVLLNPNGKKQGISDKAEIDTTNILFIFGGAFSDLDDIIFNRVKNKASVGFGQDLPTKREDTQITHKVIMEDLIEYGLIPEFLGRIPSIAVLDELNVGDLKRILTEPRNSIVKQYCELLKQENVELVFTEKALDIVAETAISRKAGARGLRSIIDRVLYRTMFNITKDTGATKCIVNSETMKGKEPIVIYG